MHFNSFEFIEHNQISARDSWKEGVHLTESGKVFLAQNLLDWINIFLCNSQSQNPEFVDWLSLSLSQVSSTHYFVLAETKLDEGFPNSQFVIDQYEIRTRRDRNKNGGGGGGV